MLNFMIGMSRKIYDKLHSRLSTSEPDLNLCLSEAEVIGEANFWSKISPLNGAQCFIDSS